MPRFFFNFKDGHQLPDEVGIDLPDMTAVRAMAVRASGEAISDLGIKFWDAQEWQLSVIDDTGAQVLKLDLTGAS